MFVDYRYDHLNSIRKAFSTLLTPLYYLANIPNEVASWTDDNLVSRDDLLGENSKLKDEVLILKTQNQKLVALESENARLRALLGSSRKLREKRLTAEVLKVNSTQFSKEITIDKGSNKDLFRGQPVVDSDGVLGQVIEVSSRISRVILINDQKHAIPVRVDRNGIRAIAQGNGKELYLRHLPNTTDIQEGDLLLSSALGEKFPDGYPVAKVISVIKKTDEPYAEILAEPTANINTVNHVLLLWPRQNLNGVNDGQ